MNIVLNNTELPAQSAVFADKRTNIAIYTLIFVIMVTVGRIQELIPGLAALKLGKVAFGLAIILFITSPKNINFRLFAMPQVKYVLALFLLGIISTPFSYWPGKSLNYMMFNFSTTIILLLLVVKIVNTYSDLKKVVLGIITSTTLLGVMALLSGGERVSASNTYDPNDLALVLVIFLPLLYFMFKNEHGILRLLLASASFVSLAAILATQSRGGFLGIATIILGIAIKERTNIIKLCLGCGVLVLVFMLFAPAGYGERITSIFKPEQDYNRTESGGRIAVWKRGIQLMGENPVLGVGPSVFEVAEATKHVDESTGTTGKWSAAHNSFVQIGAELGIPGLVLFIVTLWASIRSLQKLRRELPQYSNLRWIVNALEVGFYGYIVCGFFLSQAYAPALYLMVGLTVALVRQAKFEDIPLTT